MSEGPERDSVQLVVPPAQLAGVWANRLDVYRARHEFTLDFVRIDPRPHQPRRGIVVARVAVSPSLVLDLIDGLQAQWQEYARDALPEEVYDDEQGPGEGEDQDPPGR